MVPGTDRVLADLNMYTDIPTHYLRGIIVLKNDFFNNKQGKKLFFQTMVLWKTTDPQFP